MMSKRIWFGGLFLIFGLGILFHQVGLWDFKYILKTWWPIIFIIIGVSRLTNQRDSSHIVSYIFILVGSILLLNQWIDINVTAFIWPLIFILIGLTIIFSHRKQKRVYNSEHSIDTFSLFAGTNIRSRSDDFQGGNVGVIFGGAEIDLRETNITEKGAIFDLTAVFGGINIIVPENTRVEISGLPIFGGWEDKTRTSLQNNEAAVIKINCLTVFGGIEIKD